MFPGLSTPVVFLQNVVVDLLLGLRFDAAFSIFASHVRSRYGAEPGFITMNLPMALDALERAGIENPIVCSNMNKLAFRVSGGMDAYDEVLDDAGLPPVAMSVFASGAIPPREASSGCTPVRRSGHRVRRVDAAAHPRDRADRRGAVGRGQRR